MVKRVKKCFFFAYKTGLATKKKYPHFRNFVGMLLSGRNFEYSDTRIQFQALIIHYIRILLPVILELRKN